MSPAGRRLAAAFEPLERAPRTKGAAAALVVAGVALASATDIRAASEVGEGAHWLRRPSDGHARAL